MICIVERQHCCNYFNPIILGLFFFRTNSDAFPQATCSAAFANSGPVQFEFSTRLEIYIIKWNISASLLHHNIASYCTTYRTVQFLSIIIKPATVDLMAPNMMIIASEDKQYSII